jgi:hypothetical protein
MQPRMCGKQSSGLTLQGHAKESYDPVSLLASNRDSGANIDVPTKMHTDEADELWTVGDDKVSSPSRMSRVLHRHVDSTVGWAES